MHHERQSRQERRGRQERSERRRHPEPDGRPRPFAVGILALDAATSGLDHTAARLDLALDAYQLGYFLIDTIDIHTHGTGYLAAELLISHTTPEALLTHGPINTHWLHTLTDRHPMTIHPHERHPRTTHTTRNALRTHLRRWKQRR